MYLIQMMLGYGFGHELPYAFIKGAINYEIRTCTKRGTNTFAIEGRPFSENCRGIKVYFNVSIIDC